MSPSSCLTARDFTSRALDIILWERRNPAARSSRSLGVHTKDTTLIPLTDNVNSASTATRSLRVPRRALSTLTTSTGDASFLDGCSISLRPRLPDAGRQLLICVLGLPRSIGRSNLLPRARPETIEQTGWRRSAGDAC